MTLEGKGFYIWQIRNCEKGNPDAIVQEAVKAGLTHVLIKIADGIYPYNYDWKNKIDLAKPVVDVLKEAGIRVWGWHYVYGAQPVEEARIAIRRTKELELEGYAIDAENEYKDPDKKSAATRFMNELRKELKTTQIALSSYRFPSYHTRLPWKEFLSQCDYNMPQVYWMKSHNPGEQLQRCIREFQEIVPFRPIIPTGSAFSEQNWTASASEILEFMQTAQRLNLTALNFWSWDYCRNNLPNLWNTIADYPWSGGPAPEDFSEKYIQALNSHDVNQVIQLYDANAVHITASRTIQGSDAIRNWYQTLLTQTLPDATFTLATSSNTGNSYHFTWTASSSAGKVLNGNDTLGVLENKISYHYTSYQVTTS